MNATTTPQATALLRATKKLSRQCRALSFSAPARYVYHPLEYAARAHGEYIRRYAGGKKRALFVGINPGPWGMGQTGIPFGDVASARDWLGITAAVDAPRDTHPKRPVQGFDCPRSEVSGRRLWAFFAERYGAADNFFSQCYVMNYCPLLFLSDTGANLTPDKLPAAQQRALYAHCDAFLQTAVAVLQPTIALGVGGFAEQRLRAVFAPAPNLTIGKILHPSPASPAANKGFARVAAAQLDAFGL